MKNTLGGFFQIRQEHLAIGACHLKEQKETPLAGAAQRGGRFLKEGTRMLMLALTGSGRCPYFERCDYGLTSSASSRRYWLL